MKNFLTTFAAILCAAGVIWGIASKVQADAKQKEWDERVFKEYSKKASDMAIELSVRKGAAPDYFFDGAPDPVIFTYVVKKRGWGKSYEAKDYAKSMREVITLVRAHYPSRKKWADEIDAKLAELEKLQATGQK